MPCVQYLFCLLLQYQSPTIKRICARQPQGKARWPPPRVGTEASWSRPPPLSASWSRTRMSSSARAMSSTLPPSIARCLPQRRPSQTLPRAGSSAVVPLLPFLFTARVRGGRRRDGLPWTEQAGEWPWRADDVRMRTWAGARLP
jgi:hypothetical protein